MVFFRNIMHFKILDVWNFAWVLWFCKSFVASCPSDVHTFAIGCFNNYNTQLAHIKNTDRALFSGVDVENLRYLCSSYKSAITCIQSLHRDCPEKHKQIDVAFVSLNGDQTDPTEICQDDKILEVYARNLNCFLIHGEYSESCFQREMNLSISSLKDVSQKPLNTFCSKLKSLNTCISTNILLKCGKEAESLVNILIRASIKRSSECDDTVPLSQTSSSGTHSHNRNGNNNSNTGNSFKKDCLYVTLLISLIFLILKHSIRL